jgi:hypothetical protein
MKPGKRFLFVVDTLDYAGNFERQLCGYITGRTRDWSGDHGEDEAEIAKKELPEKMRDYFDNHIMYVVDEQKDGQPMTPMIIYPTPGWFNHGMGGHFRDGQEEEAFADYKKVSEKYKADHPGSSLDVGKELHKHPAYQSVAIVFDERPPQDIIELMKGRTEKFVKYWAKIKVLGMKVRVTGFRVVEETTQVQTVEKKV